MYLNPFPMLIALVGLLVCLAALANWRIPSRRRIIVNALRTASATTCWFGLRGWWRCKAYVLEQLEKRQPEDSQKPFKGSLALFLAHAQNNPAYCETPRERMGRLIEQQGVDHYRTMQIRRLYDDPTLVAYKAFADLPSMDPVALSKVADFFLYHRQRNVLVISGDPGCGKTELVNRLMRVYASGSPIPVVEGTPTNMNPLQVLQLIWEEASKAPSLDQARDARREMLFYLGFEDLVQKAGHLFEEACRSAGVVASFAGLCSIDDEHRFTKAVYAVLGIKSWKVPALTELDKTCLARVRTGTLDTVQVTAITPKQGAGLATVPYRCPLNFDSSLFGQLNLSTLSQYHRHDPRAMTFGEIPRANRGVVAVDEVLKMPREFIGEMRHTRGRTIPVLDGMHSSFDGVVIYVAYPNELTHLSGDRRDQEHLDQWFIVRLSNSVEADQLERLIGQHWMRSPYARNQFRRDMNTCPTGIATTTTAPRPSVCLESDVVPFLARAMAVSALPHMPLDEAMQIVDPRKGFRALRLKDVERSSNSLGLRRCLHALMQAANKVDRQNRFRADDQPEAVVTVEAVAEELVQMQQFHRDARTPGIVEALHEQRLNSPGYKVRQELRRAMAEVRQNFQNTGV